MDPELAAAFGAGDEQIGLGLGALTRFADEASGMVAFGDYAGELRVAAGAVGVKRDEHLSNDLFH